MNFELVVNEAIGFAFNYSSKISIFLNADVVCRNCPKYITLRELAPRPTTSPVVIENKLHLGVGERLSSDGIAFILESDTVWLGTTYAAAEEAQLHPSHLGMNHCGGRPGFIHVVAPSLFPTFLVCIFSTSADYRTLKD